MENKGDTLPPGVEGKDLRGAFRIGAPENLRLERLFGRRPQPVGADFTLLVPTRSFGNADRTLRVPNGRQVPESVGSMRQCRV